MYVEFKQLRFKNINSYGNSETVLDFTKGLSAIIGKNGKGKSTFLDAISFCLYGVPYRNIKIAQLINRTNKKNLLSECSFIRDKDSYVIKRTLAPASITITKNGDELQLLSSKKLIQEEIDKIIGVDYKLFKQIICLAVSYNRPYLSLSSPEKRDIIESIFNIKVFGNMLKTLKKEQASLKTEQTINSKTITILESSLSQQRKQLKNLKSSSENFTQNKEADLKDCETKIATCVASIEENQKELEHVEKQLASCDVSKEQELKDELAGLNTEKNRLEFTKEQALKDYENLVQNNEGVCPTCKTSLSEDHIKEHIDASNLSIKGADEALIPIEKRIKKLNYDIKEIDAVKNAMRYYETSIGKLKYQISSDTNSITALEAHKKDVDERELDFDVDDIEKEFNEKIEEYKEVYKSNSKIGDKIATNKVVEDVLSENGIKAHFFKKLLPILNQKINQYLKKFDLPTILTFDAFMDERITSVNGNTELPYMSFSEGEKKRIDLSILLSFIDTTKSITNWNCNLLFFDELFDSATDLDGLDKITSTVKSMTESNDKLCVYIISHRLSNEHIFDNQIDVCKDGLYSKVVVRD